jgi:hypothetical protein
MSSRNIAVFGIYATAGTAEAAVDHLLSKGFTNSAISVLLPDDDSTRAFAHEKNTKAPEGTATGVATGGIIGGTLGLLIGLGALAIPGVGPLIAAGPIIGALTGVGAGGVVGGIVGALVGMGIPEYEAKRYEGAVKGGGTLLSVHCDTNEQIAVAKQALVDTGARDIASTTEAGSVHHHDHETPTERAEDRDNTYAAADNNRSERELARDERDRAATASYNSERTAVVPPLAPGDRDYVEDDAITPRRY